jgi:hypothetical protein
MTSRLEFTHGGHRYKLDGRPVKSVTTLLQVLAKPQLVAWAANESADYAIDHWDHLAEQTPSERRALIAGAHRRRRDKAAARGTQIHAWADALTAGEAVDIPAEHVQTVEAFARWWEASGFTSVAAEQMVWSEESEYGECAYAGKYDLLADHPRYGRCLIDHKSGKGVYSEMGLQLAAYAGAENVVVDGEDRQPQPIDTLAIVHILPGETTLHLLDRQQRHLAAELWSLVRSISGLPMPEFTQAAL